MQYDRFQQEAIDQINQGFSVIVSAPTGAGKTVIAEHVITTCLQNNIGAIYTAPIKALSNQKFRDFQGQFSEHVGILTGDVSINPQAQVLIMTTEIFRNKVLDEPESLSRYSWIIFDEVHYLDNPERGTVWEESLIFLPAHMNILALSATIPNIKQLAEWLTHIHKRPFKIITEDNRPVPLNFYYQMHDEITGNFEALKRFRAPKFNRISTLIRHLRDNDRLPAIYFAFSRRKTEELALELQRENFLTHKQRDEISGMYEDLLERFDLKNEKSAAQLYPLIERGIAYHHAGMLPTLKEVVERLFTSRLIKLIFTTETFALGINMPSRTVIFDDLRKFYGHSITLLKTRDFYQMAGRAGRRGIDREGFVYCRINPRRLRPEEARRVIFSKTEEVKSQLNSSYATALNLYEKYREDIVKVYPLSFHCFQFNKPAQQEAVRLIGEKLKLLKSFGCITEGKLTDKGMFAKSVHGYELLLAELYSQGILEELDEFGLGILAVSAVFEPRKNQEILTLSKNGRRIRHVCDDIYEGIKAQERRQRIYPFSKCAYFHMSAAMEAWLQGSSFEHVLKFTDTDEGELIRYFRMSIQILREMQDAKVISLSLKERIKETLRVLNRDVVDAEKQLREG